MSAGPLLLFTKIHFGLPIAIILGLILLLIFRPSSVLKFVGKTAALVIGLFIAWCVFCGLFFFAQNPSHYIPGAEFKEMCQVFVDNGSVAPVPELKNPKDGIEYFGKPYTKKMHPQYEGDACAYYVYYLDENNIILGFTFTRETPSKARLEIGNGFPFQPGEYYPYKISSKSEVK